MEVFKLGNLYLKNVDLKKVQFNKKVENENRCYARLWGDGSFGNDRCERQIKSGCMCKKHLEAAKRMNGIWWLGLINEPRPENPNILLVESINGVKIKMVKIMLLKKHLRVK